MYGFGVYSRTSEILVDLIVCKGLQLNCLLQFESLCQDFVVTGRVSFNRELGKGLTIL